MPSPDKNIIFGTLESPTSTQSLDPCACCDPPPPPAHNAPTTPPPADNFDVPANHPTNTVFYLTLTAPHTDNFAIRGPAADFRGLLPHILAASSNSPEAIRKLAILRGDEEFGFDDLGFSTFIIPLARGAYIALKVVRKVNEPVTRLLRYGGGSPIYLITSHGPLSHDISTGSRIVSSGRAKGRAANSRLVGSAVDFERAKRIARETLLDREGKDKMKWTESGTKSSWLVFGMDEKALWEVRVEMVEHRTLGGMMG
ncbi:hypothetical protein P154DRAFT_572214 [Amniculicola lignicola CBS 123094]|uniref:Uncharacterized protein n=1 Tax=Amniculicola lignicola CBS 123094 TaxID=1392246 RepID=A0A6A5WTW6_9PLEO|nr:hypothetical protein P154DRAFT_572214 [Amniculicola lignicola CBS 123094]